MFRIAKELENTARNKAIQLIESGHLFTAEFTLNGVLYSISLQEHDHQSDRIFQASIDLGADKIAYLYLIKTTT